MKRKEIKISTRVKTLLIGCGTCELCHGIISCFNENLIIQILRWILLIICALIILSLLFFKEEKYDEMAKKNMTCARVNGLIGMFIVILVALLIQAIILITKMDYEISFFKLSSFLLAAFCLTTGISFMKYEKDGGAWLN